MTSTFPQLKLMIIMKLDIGLMTSNKRYTKDALEFFNVITGHSIADEYKNLITAPIYMRNKIISLIEDEIDHSIAGNDAKIYIKINSLQDKHVIRKLYEASNVGVKIFLIVRVIVWLRYQGAARRFFQFIPKNN